MTTYSHLERDGVPIDDIAQNLRVETTREKGLTIDDKRDGDMWEEEAKECCSRGPFQGRHGESEGQNGDDIIGIDDLPSSGAAPISHHGRHE